MAKAPFIPLQIAGKGGAATPEDLNRVQDQVRQAFQKVVNQPGGVPRITSKDGSVKLKPPSGVGVVDLSVPAPNEVDVIAAGSKSIDIGSTGPSDVIDTEPAFYGRIVVGGTGYVFPLWRESSGGVIPSSGLVLWLDAAKGITLSGSDVTAWADQSGNGFDLVGSGNPTFNATDINSLPSVSTDSGKYLSRGANLVGSGNDRDVFAVARQGTSVGYAVCSFGDGSSNGFGCNYESLGGSQRYVWTQNISGGADAYFSKSGDDSSVAHFHRWTLDSGALSYALDGTDVGGLSFDGSFVDDAASAFFTVGGLNPSIGSRPWVGSIAEVIVYNRVLSTDEAAQVTAYLSGKYGI